jgi:dihydrofolate reductase
MSRISLIVAVSQNGVIGANGTIPWHLSTDLQRFKRLTTGHCIVMGRRTFESLGRILPDRTHIVLSRDPSFHPPGIHVADSWEMALALAEGDEEIFVIGGEDVFRVALPQADRIYLTLVPLQVTGDAHFPLSALDGWKVRFEQHHSAGPRDDCDHTFRILERS